MEFAINVKKTTLQNIGNVINKTNDLTLKRNNSNSTTTSSVMYNLNSILKNVTWMSKDDSIKQEVIKKEEDDELVKFNESFKNCIQIKFFPVIKQESVKKNKCEVVNNSVRRNFKKFVKVGKLIIFLHLFNFFFFREKSYI